MVAQELPILFAWVRFLHSVLCVSEIGYHAILIRSYSGFKSLTQDLIET